MELSGLAYLIVCPLVFLAGLVDSIAGGGGLISLPAYLLAGLPPHLASGTNKLSAVFGTSMAAARYARGRKINYRAALPAALGALPGAWLGARLLLLIPERSVKVLLLVAIPLIAAFVLIKKDRFDGTGSKRSVNGWTCLLIGLLIGAYDGFLGPGTGTFLMLAFSACCGLDLVSASGSTKLVNLASNVAAMVTFALSGKVLLALALPAAAFSMAGNLLGSHLAMRRGARVIRPVFLAVLALLLLTVAYDVVSTGR